MSTRSELNYRVAPRLAAGTKPMGFPKGRSGSSSLWSTTGFKPRGRYNLITKGVGSEEFEGGCPFGCPRPGVLLDLSSEPKVGPKGAHDEALSGSHGLMLDCYQAPSLMPKLSYGWLTCPAEQSVAVTCFSVRLPRSTRRSGRILQLDFILYPSCSSW